MRIVVAAIGRLKDGPERDLFQRYWSRLEALGRGHALAPLSLVEIAESRAAGADARRAEEAAKLVAAAVGHVVLMDETGRAPTSRAFADDLRRRRDGGTAAVSFLIGGPDGHGDAARARAQATLALGALTLPHGLARVVLAEQLYRAATLIAGHPYHRA